MVDRERGTSITEVLVVVAVFAILALPLVRAVTTTLRVQADRAADHEARLELDQAIASIERDLVAATPVAARPTGTSAGDTLGVAIGDAGSGGRVLYWTVDGSGLTRTEADPTTLAVRSRTTLSTRVMAAGPSPFRYYDASGAILDPALVGAQRLADCTTLIEVSLAVAAGDGQETTTARHAVRSREPGGNGC